MSCRGDTGILLEPDPHGRKELTVLDLSVLSYPVAVTIRGWRVSVDDVPLDEAPLDLATVIRAVARRWLMVVALTSIGIVAGAGLGILSDATYRAQALVLLPPAGADSRGNPARDIATEVRLATGDDVLDDAGRRLSPPVAVTDLRARVVVDASTDDLLVVGAAGPTAAEAAAIADAVAAAYVERSNQRRQ